MASLTQVESALLRYLFTHLELTEDIKVLEDVFSDDFESYSEWVVIESLSNPLNEQPKQNFFLHCCQQKGQKRAKEKLTLLIEKVAALVEPGTQIDVYDYPHEDIVGHIEVSERSASPVLQHRGGGSMRTLSIAVTY